MSQDELMKSDECILLSPSDGVTGSLNKAQCHVFSGSQPRGVLHRAFSVFLFDQTTHKLLLQQRAAHKITFPNVWTNTCCSHPLTGMIPNEVDHNDGDGGKPFSAIGVKRAAIRKLKQGERHKKNK